MSRILDVRILKSVLRHWHKTHAVTRFFGLGGLTTRLKFLRSHVTTRYNVEMPERLLDVTALLLEWSAGDRSALDRLTPLVYKELRKTALALLANERPGIRFRLPLTPAATPAIWHRRDLEAGQPPSCWPRDPPG